MDKMKWMIPFLVAVLALFALSRYSQSSYYLKSDNIFQIEKSDIFNVLIFQNEDTLSLTYDGEAWAIDNHDTLEIKQNNLDSFLDKITSLEKGSLVSKNKKNWDKYMVGDSTGTHFVLKNVSGDIIAQATVGRSGSEWSSSNIRINNATEVYQTNENISWQLNTSADYWGEVPQSDSSQVEE